MLMGAAFLMATSSIGPGFLTQTTVFTEQLLASFGFVILTSIILDIGSQLNVWRVIGISGSAARTCQYGPSGLDTSWRPDRHGRPGL